MSKYTKLEDAMEVHRRFATNGRLASNIIEEYNNLPTIEIIRCGKCKCCQDELIEEYMPLYIYCEKWNHETGFDDFCSAGERKDNE